MSVELLQLKLDYLNAGILVRKKENEAWLIHDKETEHTQEDKEIELLEKKIEQIKNHIHENYQKSDKKRKQMIEPFFQKWQKLSTKLEKKYGIKFNGTIEKLIQAKKELDQTYRLGIKE